MANDISKYLIHVTIIYDMTEAKYTFISKFGIEENISSNPFIIINTLPALKSSSQFLYWMHCSRICKIMYMYVMTSIQYVKKNNIYQNVSNFGYFKQVLHVQNRPFIWNTFRSVLSKNITRSKVSLVFK